jgi:hypothetical protein
MQLPQSTLALALLLTSFAAASHAATATRMVVDMARLTREPQVRPNCGMLHPPPP